MLHELYVKVSEDHRRFAKEWADKGDFSMAHRCSIIAEVYLKVSRDLKQEFDR